MLVKKKGLFLLVDALFALTLVLILSLSISVFSQQHEPLLLQFHQLGRDYLVLHHKQGVNFNLTVLTGFNNTQNARTVVGSKIVVYPKLCVDPPLPNCFQLQDIFDSFARRKPLVFNATVSP